MASPLPKNLRLPTPALSPGKREGGKKYETNTSRGDFTYQIQSFDRKKQPVQHMKKEKEVQPFTHQSAEDQNRPYACPYFKNNPRMHDGCARWKSSEICRVKDHSKRVHLKHIQCMNCGEFRTSSKDEEKAHNNKGCKRVVITPIHIDAVKGIALEQKGLGWGEIYGILFPECDKRDIPPSYHEKLPRTPADSDTQYYNEVSKNSPMGHSHQALSPPSNPTWAHRASPLHQAASEGDLSRVQQLLEGGVNPSSRGYGGCTALHEAALEGHDTIVQRLLEYGADVSCADNDGQTALHKAISGFSKTPEYSNEVALTWHKGSSGGYEAAIQKLLGYGADPWYRDKNSQSPFDQAMSNSAAFRLLRGSKSQFFSPQMPSPSLSRDSHSWDDDWTKINPIEMEYEDKEGESGNLQIPYLQSITPTHTVSSYLTPQKLSPSPSNCSYSFENSTAGNDSMNELDGDRGENDDEEEDDEDEDDGEYEYENKTCPGEGSSYSYGPSPSYSGSIKSCRTAGRGSGNGRWKVDMPQAASVNQNHRVKKIKKDSENERSGRKGRKMASRARTCKPTNGRGRLYACPYFKNSSQEYRGCARWKSSQIHRVKEHCKRLHLKPIQCRNCGKFRAGDNGQMKAHQGCKRATKIIPVSKEVVAKGEALGKRGLSWSEIYHILFPECSSGDIPSPYWEENIEASAAPITDEELLPPGAFPFPGELMDGDFTNFLLDRLSIPLEAIRKLHHEYKDNRVSRSCDQSPSPGNVGNQAIITQLGNDFTHQLLIQPSATQSTNEPSLTRDSTNLRHIQNNQSSLNILPANNSHFQPSANNLNMSEGLSPMFPWGGFHEDYQHSGQGSYYSSDGLF